MCCMAGECRFMRALGAAAPKSQCNITCSHAPVLVLLLFENFEITRASSYQRRMFC